MTYVYVLSVHDEYGAEEVCATLHRDRLEGMLRRNWARCTTEWLDEAAEGLRNHLLVEDETLANRGEGRDCMRGWGGVQLHVVGLQ